MSRNADRITRALATKGYEVVNISWRPPGPFFEKLGQLGGWTVEIDPTPPPRYGFVSGGNVQEVLEEIEGLPVVERKEMQTNEP